MWVRKADGGSEKTEQSKQKPLEWKTIERAWLLGFGGDFKGPRRLCKSISKSVLSKP